MPAKAVIHTVGPVWHGGDQSEPELLASCYRNSLSLAEQYDLKTIAFPAISCGVYGYPISEAVDVAVSTIREHLKDSKLDEVILVAFNDEILAAYEQALEA